MLPVTGLMPVKNGWLCHSRSDLLTVGIRYTLVYLANSSFYVISYNSCNVLRLEMSICLEEEKFIYPVFFKGTTSVDYEMATFVLSRDNNVTMQELMAYYNEKEDTDACLRNLEPEQFDFDNSLDTQAEDLMSIYPWILLTTIMKNCLVN